MNNIKSLRLKFGMSQQEVADKLGVNRSAEGQWERGDSNVSYETAKRFADLFHVSVLTVIGEDALKADFRQENLLDLIPTILNSRFDSVVLDDSSSSKEVAIYWILSYLFEYDIKDEDIATVLNYLQYAVKNNGNKVLNHHLDNLIKKGNGND